MSQSEEVQQQAEQCFWETIESIAKGLDDGAKTAISIKNYTAQIERRMKEKHIAEDESLMQQLKEDRATVRAYLSRAEQTGQIDPATRQAFEDRIDQLSTKAKNLTELKCNAYEMSQLSSLLKEREFMQRGHRQPDKAYETFNAILETAGDRRKSFAKELLKNIQHIAEAAERALVR